MLSESSRKIAIVITGFVSVALTGCGASSGQSNESAPSCTEQSTFFDEVFRLTNTERQKVGLMPLTLSLELIQAAQAHAVDMASNDYFSHTGLNGSTPGTRTAAFQYGSSFVGENIAAGYSTPTDVVQGWMDSPGHRANILNMDYTEIGLGFFNNPSAEFGNYWVQVFGDRPVASKTSAPVSAQPTNFVGGCVELQTSQNVVVKGWNSFSETNLGTDLDSSVQINVVPIPEPKTLSGLVVFGLGLLIFYRK